MGSSVFCSCCFGKKEHEEGCPFTAAGMETKQKLIRLWNQGVAQADEDAVHPGPGKSLLELSHYPKPYQLGYRKAALQIACDESSAEESKSGQWD